MTKSFTFEDLFVISIGGLGEGCGPTEIMFTFEALNVEPNKLFEAVKTHAVSDEFQVVDGTKCTLVLDFVGEPEAIEDMKAVDIAGEEEILEMIAQDVALRI